MIHKIITPKVKEELILNLPEEFLNKTIDIYIQPEEDLQVVENEAVEFWNSMNIDCEDYIFDREDANAKPSLT